MSNRMTMCKLHDSWDLPITTKADVVKAAGIFEDKWPAWLGPVVHYVGGGDWGIEWRQVVEGWVKLEKAMGFRVLAPTVTC